MRMKSHRPHRQQAFTRRHWLLCQTVSSSLPSPLQPWLKCQAGGACGRWHCLSRGQEGGDRRGGSVTITAQQAVDLITSSVSSFKTNALSHNFKCSGFLRVTGIAGSREGAPGARWGSRLCAQQGKHAPAPLEAPVGVRTGRRR